MKIKLIATLALACLSAFGQTNFAAAGISYNPGASPAIAGTGLYARAVNGSGTYAFTVIDALPATVKPFTVSTAVSAGVAQKLLTINGVDIFAPTAAGISYTGKNTGWQWSTGGLACIKVKGSWRVMPNLRFLKSSISDSGYQVIGGVMLAWGW